jgi:tetratricopeptide (TPR) repeat protein
MRGRLAVNFALILIVLAWTAPPVGADELSDAIRQANDAREESRRMSRTAEEGRFKSRQLYGETKFMKFQLAAEDYVSAGSHFDRAADAFQRASYYLDRLRSTRNASLLDDAQSNFREAGEQYNEAVQSARRAAERFNGGIEEYNRQLQDERKRKADKNRTDAFDLMKSTEEQIKKIESRPNSAGVVTCLKAANQRARWAFTEFHGAVENAGRADAYKDKTEAGIRYYNEAVQILKRTSETGNCSN